VTKAAKQSMISSLYTQIEDHIKKQGASKYGIEKRLLLYVNSSLPDNMKITRNDIGNFRRKQREKDPSLSAAENIVVVRSEDSSVITVVDFSEREKIGRHVGANGEKKRNFDFALVAAHNDITAEHIQIPTNLVRKRVCRNRILVTNNNGKGSVSPVLHHDDFSPENITMHITGSPPRLYCYQLHPSYCAVLLSIESLISACAITGVKGEPIRLI